MPADCRPAISDTFWECVSSSFAHISFRLVWSGLAAISHTQSVPLLNDIPYYSCHVPCQCMFVCNCGYQKSIICTCHRSISFRVTSATLAKTDSKVLSLSITRAATALIPSPIHIQAAYHGHSQAMQAMRDGEMTSSTSCSHGSFYGIVSELLPKLNLGTTGSHVIACKARTAAISSGEIPAIAVLGCAKSGAWLIPKLAGTMTHLGCPIWERYLSSCFPC